MVLLMNSLNDKELVKKRVLQIVEKVPLLEILSKYYPSLNSSYPDHEQQFSCDLHGSNDEKPSARFYPSSNTTFCFGCAKVRNAIDYVITKEGVSFSRACSLLEQAYGIEPPSTKIYQPEELPKKTTQELFPKLERKMEGLLLDLKQVLSPAQHLKFLELFFKFKETQSEKGLGNLIVRANHHLQFNQNNVG